MGEMLCSRQVKQYDTALIKLVVIGMSLFHVEKISHRDIIGH
jgi:hypothetical protein